VRDFLLFCLLSKISLSKTKMTKDFYETLRFVFSRIRFVRYMVSVHGETRAILAYPVENSAYLDTAEGYCESYSKRISIFHQKVELCSL
jgi:hypothetical protein